MSASDPKNCFLKKAFWPVFEPTISVSRSGLCYVPSITNPSFFATFRYGSIEHECIFLCHSSIWFHRAWIHLSLPLFEMVPSSMNTSFYATLRYGSLIFFFEPISVRSLRPSRYLQLQLFWRVSPGFWSPFLGEQPTGEHTDQWLGQSLLNESLRHLKLGFLVQPFFSTGIFRTLFLSVKKTSNIFMHVFGR
jgi:hypothetical protein